MNVKLIIEDSFFNIGNIQKLKKGEKYAVLVLEQLFFFVKDELFENSIDYTVQVHKAATERNLLGSLFDSQYQNDSTIIKKASILLTNLKFVPETLGVINVKNGLTNYYYLKTKREDDCKSELLLSDVLNRENVTSSGFRTKKTESISQEAERFLNKKVAYRKFYDLESDYFPSVGIEYKAAKTHVECGYGRSSSFLSSENIALLEAVERYCSFYYPFKTKDIYGTVRQYSNAVHPSNFILPSSDENPFRKYNDDLNIFWTKAESVKNKNMVLVPEQLVVYGDSYFRDNKKHNRFIYDSSNGVSLGGSYAEAVLYGLLEIIERDNFLKTWYGTIPVDEINLKSLGLSEEVLRAIKHADNDGYDTRVYDISTDLNIPCFWALVRSRTRKNVFSYSAAGCNPDYSKAAETALMEALVGISTRNNWNKKSEFQEPSKVARMEDHVNYYLTDKHAEAFDFLDKSEKVMFSKEKFIHPRNTLECLRLLIEKILIKYDDIYVINLTSRYMESLGIFTVKVLVPGMLPITFGVQNERVSMMRINNERSRKGLETLSDVNVFPHPFP